MQKILLLTLLLTSFCFYGQDYIITDGTINVCSGNLLDSGGRSNSYGNNERIVITICPENPADFIRLNFIDFSTEDGVDTLALFNGDSENTAELVGVFSGNQNPGIVAATDATPTGCLTFVFQSDSENVSRGFEAVISCINECQTITSQINSSSPSPNADDIIRVCPGEEISLTGSGIFEEDGNGATYEFDLGDGRTIDGRSAIFSYSTPGVYLVNLNIRDTNTTNNPEGCKNTNILNQVIQVGNEPDFAGTEAENSSICLGNETIIKGVVTPIRFDAECTPPISGTTFLPDGTGVEYSTCITVDCFDSDQTITDGGQLVNICINMEHSWAEDLDIKIVSPSGREVVLFSQKGSQIYLGGPIDDDVSATEPGVGRTYCFDISASVLLENASLVTDGDPPRNSFQPGTYLPLESFNALVGSPLNGDWCLKIRDNLPQDNGYIFEWNMTFDPNLIPAELSYTPEIVSEQWDADPSITDFDRSNITVKPTTTGQHCYTFRVLDDFGCEYDEQVCIDVYPAVMATEPELFKICDNLDAIDGFGEFDLSSRDNEILNGQNPSINNVNYYESLSDAEQNINPLPGIYYNVTNPQLIYARVENTSAPAALCFAIVNVNLEVDLIPDLSLPEMVRVCTDLNGSEEVENPVLDTGLIRVNYTFEWFRDGELIPGANGSTIIADLGGTYMVTVTDTTTGCTNSKSTDVVESSPPILTADVTSNAFASNNSIEASASGFGEYEYSLNNGPFQLDGRFDNVPAGNNTVIARDINGCGSASASVTVLNFPKFFTPNNDGQNDTWNVKGLSQQNAIIYIYDRYGKLLKQLNPLGKGWNGTLQGVELPSSDYWFTIIFIDPASGNRSRYSSHFSLKR